MLPEVKAYFDALGNARKKYDEEYANKPSTEVVEHFKTAKDRAWESLKKSSTPLVAWIANDKEISEVYRDYAEVILRELPATVTELDKIAQQQDWCRVWNRFRAKAIAEGVIKVDYQIRMKMNGYSWRPFYSVQLPYGGYITKDELNKLFSRGVDFIQYDIRGETYRFEVVPSDT